MNANTVKALVLDAYYQVVDNTIFRLLLVLEALIISCFFLVSFGKEQVSILFGAWNFSYADMFAARGMHYSSNADVQGIAVQAVQQVVVETLSGSLGMIVCLCATSFFMPRLLEKGAADIVFAKPVSRLALMLSRYVSGLFFVGILAVLGVGGVWLGLAVSSGYNDPGVLWGALTLLYLFAILHAVSILIGVLTRSTVAAMLVSILFFVVNGSFQGAWLGCTYLREAGVTNPRTDADPEERAASEAAAKSESAFERSLRVSLQTYHLLMPKTGDADVLTQKLRRSVEGETWKLTDPVAKVTIPHAPAGLALVQPPEGTTTVDLAAAPVIFASPDQSARIEISRRPREFERVDATGKAPPRKRRLTTQQAADEVLARVRASGRAVGEIGAERTEIDQLSTLVVSWKEADAGHRVYVATFGDHVLEIHLSAPGLGPPGARHEIVVGGSAVRFGEFLGGISVARETQIPGPAEWYAQRLTWDGPLDSNIGFSIASSLLFAAIMLALAWARLRKIDF